MSSAEIVEKISGVGAFIIVPEDPEFGFLTIKEQRSKRLSAKLKGSRSLPMETLEGNESHQEGLHRLFKEEINVSELPINLTQIKLCACELTPGVVLHAYLIEIESSLRSLVGVGSESAEVGEIHWTTFNEVFQAKGSLRFRPGVFEVMSSYLEYRTNPDRFKPDSHRRLRDEIPAEIFDLLEHGVSQTEALSRLGLVDA